ncbi:GNAT family N-acetyltransferase [Nonomuraea rubra]|uniref:GNAT family N-acetyltransferase n=1 Tax=Nonomuraea rubra TaxID=46180 RepID=UPI003CD0A372
MVRHARRPPRPARPGDHGGRRVRRRGGAQRAGHRQPVVQPAHRPDRPPRVRQGLPGSEAIELVLRHAFETTPLHRIRLGVYAFNERARHVYKKLGFVGGGRRARRAPCGTGSGTTACSWPCSGTIGGPLREAWHNDHDARVPRGARGTCGVPPGNVVPDNQWAVSCI